MLKALYMACSRGHNKVVEILLKSGANFRIRNLEGHRYVLQNLMMKSNKIRKILVGKVGIFVNLIALILFVYLGVKLFITAIN
jgi:ankyrin repeat protein